MKRILKRNSIFSNINNYAYDSLLPSNLSYFFNFGSILSLFLLIQILSGFFLASYYIADISLAFDSIEYIMREVNYGYIIRYLHANSATLFFFSLFLHISRNLLYGSYTLKRSTTWFLGIIILFLMILTAFLGYSLVYGQMSYWAIAVITNLLSVIPYFGKSLVLYIYGGYNIGNSTLTRFFALHYLFPFLISLFSILHLISLHSYGGTNPLSLNSVRSLTLINFHPYYSFKDLFGFFIVFPILFFFLFFSPNYLSHTDNYIPANPLVTPLHISPEIYLLYFYMGLRSIPNKVLGVILLFTFLLLLFLLPYLHKGILSTTFFRPYFKPFLFLFFLNFLFGTYLGGLAVSSPILLLGQISSLYYIIFILIIVPLLSFLESFFFIILFN